MTALPVALGDSLFSARPGRKPAANPQLKPEKAVGCETFTLKHEHPVTIVACNAEWMPAFISLRGISRGTEPGFLGMSYRPFSPTRPGVDKCVRWPRSVRSG